MREECPAGALYLIIADIYITHAMFQIFFAHVYFIFIVSPWNTHYYFHCTGEEGKESNYFVQCSPGIPTHTYKIRKAVHTSNSLEAIYFWVSRDSVT